MRITLHLLFPLMTLTCSPTPRSDLRLLQKSRARRQPRHKEEERTGFTALVPTRPGLKRSRRKGRRRRRPAWPHRCHEDSQREKATCARGKFVFLRVGHCVRKGGGRKKIETQSKKGPDTKSQCAKPQAVHHSGLPGAIQSASEPRSRSSGPRGSRAPGQAHR